MTRHGPAHSMHSGVHGPACGISGREEANGGAGRVMRSVHGASRSSWVTAASGASACSTHPARGRTEPPARCLAGGDARSEASCKASVCFTWDF